MGSIILPPGACILQNKLRLKTNIGAFDFNLGCSGFIYGLAVARSLVNSGVASNVLLVTAETYTKHIHPKDKSNRTIFGDGAAATVIEKSEIDRTGEFILGTDGRGYKNLIVPNGGLRNRYDINAKEIDDGSGSIRTDNNLYMNGPEIFNFTIEVVPKLVLEVLERNKTTSEDLDYVIFHQVNERGWKGAKTRSKLCCSGSYWANEARGNYKQDFISAVAYRHKLPSEIKINRRVPQEKILP